MAVAFVSDITNSTGAASSTVTAASVPGSTGNFLAIGISFETVTTPGTTVSTVTYNGSGTGLSEAVFIDAFGRAASIWTMANPAGTADVVVTLTGTNSSQRISVNAAVFSGAGSAPNDNDETSVDSTTPISVTLTTAASDALYMCLTRVGNDQAGTTPTTGLGITEISNFGSSGASITHKAAYKLGSDGGQCSYDMSGGSDAVLVAINIPAAAGATAVPVFRRHYQLMKQ